MESAKALTATRDGFSLNASVACRAGERKKLERLCRYVARPPLALERLSRDGDGLVVHELGRPFRDGTTEFLFEPLDFLARSWRPSCRDREAIRCATTASSPPTPATPPPGRASAGAHGYSPRRG